MRYLLDTGPLTAYLLGRPGAVMRFDALIRAGEMATSAALPTACVSKTQSFSDDYWSITFSLVMDTNFSWNGNCGKPTMRDGYPQCMIEYLAGILIGSSCVAYSPDYRSEAGKFSVSYNPASFPFMTFTIWERRQCYNDGNCDFHTDLG